MTTDLMQVLDVHEQTIAPLHRAYSEAFWAMSTRGREQDVEAFVAARRSYLGVYNDREVFGRLKTWRTEPPARLGDVDARRLERMYLAFLPYQMDSEALAEIVRREARIENTFNTFRSDLDGKRVSDNELRGMLASETDPGRRRRAWEASKQVGNAVAADLRDLVELRNAEARALGYRDYYQLMLETSELSEDWLFTMLDELETASEVAYIDMKAALDSRLRDRFGMEGPEAWPWLYSDPFFQELPSEGITETLDRIFAPLDIVALTREHFGSLGMQVGDLLERADLYEREGKSQHAFCLDVDRGGDVRVLCNLKSDERWMSTMLHEFGHAVYDKYSDPKLPFSLREPAHVFTTEAIAMLNGRMTKVPAWLVRFAGVDSDVAKEIGPSAYEGMRSSMLIFLRWGLTLVRFERALYADPRQDLDALWWSLVERIQRIDRPVGRSSPDWASKIHLAVSPVYYQNYILGELMASQILAHIEREIAPNGRIFDASVGEYLVRQVFEPGARWHWNEMIERATGEGLNPDYFLTQFGIQG